MQRLDAPNGASVVDTLIAQVPLSPERLGITMARAAGVLYVRDETETQADFLAQVKAAARVAGLAWVEVIGAVATDDA